MLSDETIKRFKNRLQVTIQNRAIIFNLDSEDREKFEPVAVAEEDALD